MAEFGATAGCFCTSGSAGCGCTTGATSRGAGTGAGARVTAGAGVGSVRSIKIDNHGQHDRDGSGHQQQRTSAHAPSGRRRGLCVP